MHSPPSFFAQTAELGTNSPTLIEQPDRLSSSPAQAATSCSPALMTFHTAA